MTVPKTPTPPTSSRVRRVSIAALTLTALAMANPLFSAVSSPKPIASPADTWSFADVADLFVDAPVVARVRVTEAIALKDQAPRPGTIRYYLTADLVALIRGTGDTPPRIAFIADVPLDSRGRAPKLRKADFMVAALPVAGRPAELRLAARDALVPWNAALEARVRAIVSGGLAANAPPRITGVGGAFHTPGNLPGESETQIFLTTGRADPVSLSVLRRPGQAPQWAVALGEIVDEAALQPQRDTLGWYRLACFLPRALPSAATSELSATDAAAAATDYAFVIESLGSCTRTRS
jgi:hypothetical protein